MPITGKKMKLIGQSKATMLQSPLIPISFGNNQYAASRKNLFANRHCKLN